ncbi:MAG TPA: GerMN domain-containing protein [Candidatus Acidoferrales bacterium]|nr:GerMN domain-containing protein [Candidatus Acidoferrales bacterium]
MPRNLKIAFAIMGVAVLIGLIGLRGLHDRVKSLAEAQAQKTEAQSRREVLAPKISTPSDTEEQVNIFWAAGPGKVEPVEVELPLSADPVERAKEVLQELILNPPTQDQRTIPADTTVLGFYILPDGTAVADFSVALTSEMPSGILSEQNAVNSLVKTLAANVPGLRRLKILVHGQEVETLAGHVDLTGFFDLNAAAPQKAAASQSAPASVPASAASATAGAPKPQG